MTSAIVLSSMLDRLLNTRIDPHRSQMDIDRRRLANSCLVLWNDYGKRGALALLCEPTDELWGKVLAVSGATSIATEQDLRPAIRLFVRRRSGSGISIISPQAIRGRMFGSAG